MPARKKRATKRKTSQKENSPRWKYFWTVLRVSIGFIFLWGFFDKLFGLGFNTAKANAWIYGGSPTAGFLAHAVQGPFAGIFHAMASSNFVAWIFMLGLLFVGLTMILGIGLKLSAIVGTVMLFLMWAALLLPADNPFMDYHWFFAYALIASALTKAGNYFGLGKWWSRFKFVKKCPILE